MSCWYALSPAGWLVVGVHVLIGSGTSLPIGLAVGATQWVIEVRLIPALLGGLIPIVAAYLIGRCC